MAVFPFSCTGQARGSQRPLLYRRRTSASTAVDTNHSGWQNKSVQCISSAAAEVVKRPRKEGKAACSLRACVVVPVADEQQSSYREADAALIDELTGAREALELEGLQLQQLQSVGTSALDLRQVEPWTSVDLSGQWQISWIH